MFVPMFKGREKVEYKAIKEIRKHFSDQVIPLIEILKENHKKEIDYDPITNMPKIEVKNGRNYKVYKSESDENVNTLEFLNEMVEGKTIFIDYFRYDIEKYGKNININGVSLSYKLNNDQNLYFNKLKELVGYPNMIPVISIKKEYEIGKSILEELLIDLQNIKSTIAIRITDELYDKYSDLIQQSLRETDYLLFDIENQNPETKFIELSEIGLDENKFKKILLCATRGSLQNGGYPDRGVTDLIYTNTKSEAELYNFDGYGDYCGLKDDLPTNSGGNLGASIALFYDATIEKFYSYVEKDTSLGQKGYKRLVPIIISDDKILDINKDCPVFKTILEQHTIGKDGGWCTWKVYCILRYVDQVLR